MHWIDPEYLPETSGVVACFLVNEGGEADGLVFSDGMEVHFPPRIGEAVLAAVRPGAAVRVRGVRPRGAEMISAVSIAPGEGSWIVDAGPQHDRGTNGREPAHGERSVMEAQGIVRKALPGPKGEVRGLLLEDGRAGRFPPHAAGLLAPLLVPGKPVPARGRRRNVKRHRHRRSGNWGVGGRCARDRSQKAAPEEGRQRAEAVLSRLTTARVLAALTCNEPQPGAEGVRLSLEEADMPDRAEILSWLHIGDLHITRAGEENHRDLLRIVDLTQGLAPGSFDCALLPGDNADDGTPEQFSLVRDAVARLRMPLHILPGDHDFKPRTLDPFHSVLGAERLPKAVAVKGHRCLFLDVVSAGSGGPDFRLGVVQLAWLERELDDAEAKDQTAAVFMHTYPADLREGAEPLGALLSRPHVACVDMGHTHYNELANDGRTVFMATRSTGQIEEGPPGFSVAAIDGGGVSWRFKTLDRPWPLVLITAPVDRRLVTRTDHTVSAPLLVRAKIVGDAPIEAAEVRVDDREWAPMAPSGADCVWQASAPIGERVTVRARDARGRTDKDAVEPARADWSRPARHADGSDADRVGAWPEKGIFDTQLGPNRKGRKW